MFEYVDCPASTHLYNGKQSISVNLMMPKRRPTV